MFRYSRPLATAASAALLVIGGSFAAGAAEDKEPPAAGLPGVNAGYSIVKPAPEPDDIQDADTDEKKRFKAGNWDVEVSGYIWYQVGASSDRR